MSINWRGRRLETFETVVQCMAICAPAEGGAVQAALDERPYEKGREGADETLNALNLTRNPFYGEWNRPQLTS